MSWDREDHVRLDLSGYERRERALELAGQGCPGEYTRIARECMADAPALTEGLMLFGSVVSRMRGLHEAVVREISADNPHAVLPLLRAWVEVVTITLYVLHEPRYVCFLLYGPGDGRPGKKSFEAMFHAVKADAAQLRLVYGSLSEYSHFGQLGIWNAHSIDDNGIVGWTDRPQWRDDRHFRIACAWSYELAVASQHYLGRLGSLLICVSGQPEQPD